MWCCDAHHHLQLVKPVGLNFFVNRPSCFLTAFRQARRSRPFSLPHCASSTTAAPHWMLTVNHHHRDVLAASIKAVRYHGLASATTAWKCLHFNLGREEHFASVYSRRCRAGFLAPLFKKKFPPRHDLTARRHYDASAFVSERGTLGIEGRGTCAGSRRHFDFEKNNKQ